MGYATVKNVESEFKNIDFTSSTLVTKADIESFLVQTDALINAYVGAKYVVPITGDDSSVALMRLFSITLVADRVKKILETRQVTNTSANQEVRGAYGKSDVMRDLASIKKGEMPLAGATLLLGSGQGAMFSNNTANGVEPIMRKDEDQW